MTGAAQAAPLKRLWWAGGGAVLLYVAVAIVTGGRPLFDGFAPPVPYRWVNPPPEFAAGNQPPEAAERTVPLTAEGNEATNASTTDAQIIVTLPTATVPANPPDTAILLKLTPLDAATLAPLPEGLKAHSNAYQVTMTFQPSGTPVTGIKTGPAVAMTASGTSTKLLFSADGRGWQEIPGRPFGSTQGLTGGFNGPGYYLVAAPPSATPTTTAPAGGSGGAAGVVVGVAALGAVGVAAYTLRSRRQQRRERERARAKALTRTRTGPPKSRPKPQPRKKPKRR